MKTTGCEVLGLVETMLGKAQVSILSVKPRGHTLRVARLGLKTSAEKRKDYSDLEQKDFALALKEIRCLAELEGLANRRRWLNCETLPKWSKQQIEMIKERKWQIEHGKT